jgi:gliding motility-associated-like protein
MIGNTLNLQENGLSSSCNINTNSTTNLNLNSSDTILAAYLYWAGSGTGDFEVKLNSIDITPTRTFADTQDTNDRPFFSAFADVTTQVLDSGNGDYTLSELDLTTVISDYCGNATNFGGWSIIIIYNNDALPLNQINVYDGLQHVPTDLTIELTNLNVIDDIGAKIGFLAWEGDAGLSVNESLLINGNLIGNPPLNPSNNAFNGTNSFTGQNDLYNMDMDFYDIQNNIDIGDTTATIQLTSGQDFVMINTIITKLNSQLPDATVTIDEFEITNCNELETLLNFTVYNNNSTEVLPLNTSINIYANDILLANTFTTTDLPIDGSESFELTLTIPESELQDFILSIIVDEEEVIIEINENNNTDSINVLFPLPPTIQQPENIEECNIGFETGNFDLNDTYTSITENLDLTIETTFYPSENDLLNETNAINTLLAYQNTSNPQTIFIKAENSITGCFSTTTFDISVFNCPPTIPESFSPNGDGINEEFEILGLANIFDNYEIQIYNRWGNLVFEGNNNQPFWNGNLLKTNKTTPTATYFYTLYLNDSNYEPIQNWVYLRR